MWAKSKQTGFTIVELLIVVVVIAILAAIIIVSYNGIQDRALRAQTASAVNSWEKILRTYTINGGANLTPGEGTCLSAAATDYPAGDGFQAGECMTGGNVFDATYITALKDKSVAQLPSTKLTTISYGSTKVRGVYAMNMGGLVLIYIVKGTTCLNSTDGAVVSGNAVQCTRTIQTT